MIHCYFPCENLNMGFSLPLKDVIAVGNGVTSSKYEQNVSILQFAPLRTISMFKCWKEYPNLSMRKGVVCARSNNQTSICHGDSGGPLTTADTGKLVGIASFVSAKGCDYGLPQGFTCVSFYLEWIEKETSITCKK